MRTLIAIPVHNEEKYLAGIIRQVRRLAPECDVLAVDDGSTDASPEILRQFPDVAVLTHERNCGYGRTISDAFAYADEWGYDWVITLDADEQHDPGQIQDFLKSASRDDADVISGSRYRKDQPSYQQVPGDRRQINHLITVLLNSILKTSLTDSFCGFKAYRVAGLRRLRLTVAGYAFPIQFWVQAARAGLRIEEIPIKLIYHDPTRRFGGGLDDAAVRLRHYIEVLVSELADPVGPVRAPEGSASCCPCGPG
jgi:glycosyltransferase involved in cell wall biosynthesis